jgi:hypothetical protein
LIFGKPQINVCPMSKSEFAQRLMAVMEKRGISSRQELSDITQIPYHRLNPWFAREKAKPNAKDTATLVKVLRVPAEHLLEGAPITEEQEAQSALAFRLADFDEGELRDIEIYFDFLLSRRDQPKSGSDTE